MAIKIPSKSIYSVENPKIRDNIINNVQLDCVNGEILKEQNKSVFSTRITNGFVINEAKTDYEERKTSIGQVINKAFVSLKSIYLKEYYIEFSDSIKNGYISKTYEKLNKEEQPNIANSTQYTMYHYVAKEGTVKNITAQGIEGGEYELFETKETTSSNTELSKLLHFRAKDFDERFADAYIKEEDETNLTNVSISYSNNKYSLKVTVLCGAIQEFGFWSTTFGAIRYEYIPNSVTINFFGETVILDITQKTLQYGSGSKPFKVDNNELMQTTNFLSSTNENALESQYTNLLEQYKNGKEYAVINCSISEYKDQDGNVVINPKESGKMLFEMYDIVIPYKQGFVNGVQQDVPLSKYPNGEPKQFQVLGVKPHTSGVLRQELTLQEISQSTLQNK